MAISAEAVRASVKICFGGGNIKNFTISRLNPDASEDSLILLAEAVSMLQGTAPLELTCTCEYSLINNDKGQEGETVRDDDTAGGESGSAGAPKIASIIVADKVSAIGRDDIATAEGASFSLFSDAGFTTEITGTGTIELINAVTMIYIRVTAPDGIVYYAVEVTRAGSGSGGLLNVAGQYITAGGETGAAGASGIAHVFIHDTG